MALIIRLSKQDKDFIYEYVHINMKRYKEMVREIFPNMTPVMKEIKADFAKIFQEYEMPQATNMAKAIVYDWMVRRLNR